MSENRRNYVAAVGTIAFERCETIFSSGCIFIGFIANRNENILINGIGTTFKIVVYGDEVLFIAEGFPCDITTSAMISA